MLPAGEFDLVYTGIGALCWLPSITEWAGVVAELLAPGGTLHIREGHPILWSMNETLPGLTLAFPYFEQSAPLEWDDDSTYVEVSAPLQSTRTYEWNRGPREIVTALLDRGLRLDALIEHDSVPWEALPGRMTLRADGEYALTEQPPVMPLSIHDPGVEAGVTSKNRGRTLPKTGPAVKSPRSQSRGVTLPPATCTVEREKRRNRAV